MKFLDISGFGHSGKTVIADILKEVEGFQLSNYNFEFNLIRIQGGLLDLKFALVDNWSPIRSDSAIRRFIKLINRIGPKASIYTPSTLFRSNGMNYDSFFDERFTTLSRDYVSSLVTSTYKGYWPYPMIEESMIDQFFARLKGKIGISPSLVDVYITDSCDFQLKTKNYLIELFNTIKEEITEVFVLLNSLEPFNSQEGLNLLGDSKQIVVNRDPRDIYVASLAVNAGFIPNFETKYNMGLKKYIVGSDVDSFIKRLKTYYENVISCTNEDRILRINYEDFVLNYEKALVNLYDFLEVCPAKHKNRGKYFEPNKSMANIGLWKNFHDQTAVLKIEKSLGEYYNNFNS